MTRTVAIHQPEYFPWLGLLDKARRADVFVFLDSVQFDRSSLQNRAKVLGPHGVVWLTIPFKHKFPQRVDEVDFADHRWSTKHLKTLQAAYGRSPAFRALAPTLQAFFETPYTRLVDATVASCELLFDTFGVRPPEVVRASSLGVEGEKSDLVLEICRKVGADRYLSGKTGASYLAGTEFESSGVEIVVQAFEPPPYASQHPRPAEASGLSSLDAWLSLGSEAKGFLGARA